MASYTKTTRHKRKIRDQKSGRAAAANREKKGTTPIFPIHTPEADANAPQEAKQS